MFFPSEDQLHENSIVNPPEGDIIKGPVLVVFEDRIMDIIRKNHELEEVGVIKECAPATVYRIKGCGVYLYQTPIGSPATAIFMERAIALGGRRFLFFGSCGGLVPEVKSGQLIVPTEAYRGEGTSPYYLPYDDYIRMDGADRLTKLMKEHGMEFITGRVCSTDAMFRETKTYVDKRISEGCIGIEMECSLISALSKCRGVFAASLLFTDDVLSEDEWSTYEDSAVLNSRTLESVISIASKI